MTIKTIYSRGFQSGHNTYAIEVSQTQDGMRSLKIKHGKRTGNQSKDTKIIVFSENVQRFREIMIEALAETL